MYGLLKKQQLNLQANIIASFQKMCSVNRRSLFWAKYYLFRQTECSINKHVLQQMYERFLTEKRINSFKKCAKII